VEYSLTEPGREVAGLLRPLMAWTVERAESAPVSQG
jgi:DNA-binding HxlR family transcriptional regulator